MSINILFSLNIYHMSFTSSFFGLSLPKFQMAWVLTRQYWGEQHFWSSELAAQTDTTPFTKVTEGGGYVKFGQWAEGKPCTWNLGHHAPSKCATQNITQLPTSTKLLPTFIKTTLKIHRIMNGLKECIWKQREPNYTPSCNRVPRSYTK